MTVEFQKKPGQTLEGLIGDRMKATVTFEKAWGQTLSKLIGGDRMDATVFFKKAWGQTLEKLIGTKCTATVTFRKKPGQTLSKLIGSSVTVTVNFRRGRTFGGGHGGGFSGGISIPKINIPKFHFASGGVVDKPTYALAGEDGPEAFVPLKNNTEWTGIVADLITKHMSTIPNNQFHMTNPGTSTNRSELLELVMLLRELRTDVAAIKSGDKNSTITVYTQLDGATVAKKTINYINRQARVTGKNPLGANI